MTRRGRGVLKGVAVVFFLVAVTAGWFAVAPPVSVQRVSTPPARVSTPSVPGDRLSMGSITWQATLRDGGEFGWAILAGVFFLAGLGLRWAAHRGTPADASAERPPRG